MGCHRMDEMKSLYIYALAEHDHEGGIAYIAPIQVIWPGSKRCIFQQAAKLATVLSEL